ncbi:MAG TPA: hypothetical protein DDW55_05970 [Gammaproteobacteria bacterium]|nr:hypothetical protein [Gammaproteobacteria bacterium]
MEMAFYLDPGGQKNDYTRDLPRKERLRHILPVNKGARLPAAFTGPNSKIRQPRQLPMRKK